MTRAARSEGVPTVPSRWLLRLDAVLRAVGLDGALRPDDTVRRAVERIDRPEEYRPLPAPEPRPPLAARPRQLSVTQIEIWLRDPYAIYARHILGLSPLEELDADPGRAELGTVIHRTLNAFFRCFPHGLPPNPEEELLRIGQEAVSNAVRHGHATKIEVALNYGEDALSLRVSDDGTGFVPAGFPAAFQDSMVAKG